MNIRFPFALAIAVASVAARAADFYTDFPVGNGNNGANGWTLGYYDAASTSFTAFSTYTDPGSDGIARWSDPSNESLLVPAAFRNTTGGTVHGIAPGQAALHGGQRGEIAVARYTIGTTGRYSVSALFGAGDHSPAGPYGNVDAFVFVNGAQRFAALNTAIDQGYGESLYLTAGSTVDFRVGIGGDTFYNDSTPLSAQVTAVPGPGALAAFGLGMAGKLRRRRKA